MGIFWSDSDSPVDDSAKHNLVNIIVDEPTEDDALDFQRYSKNLASIIRETTPPQFAVGIFGKWGTGKTTLMKMIKRELDNDNEKILTVWFDAWRYEREKYLAVIPFLRQISIVLENDLTKEKGGKTKRWEILRNGLRRTFSAFIESTDLSVSVPGSPVSGTTNLERVVDSLQSKGSTHIDSERIPLHEHATDHLKKALEYLEKQNPGTRIVVFVDDLDRCTPEKALEVIESIKAFFDIRGIVYVIGMDSDSIDHIVKQKYGENSSILGLDYLQKIVQLPFQIPEWKSKDIEGSIQKIITKGLESSKLVGEFLNPELKKLIVNAIEPNPRQVKRFVNNVILANAVFGEDVQIDKLITVQALNFNRDWRRFLEKITEKEIRKAFFDEHYFPRKNQLNHNIAFESYIRKQSEAKEPPPRDIIDIFQELIEPKSNSLIKFLNSGAAEILRDIDDMEKYRRASEATTVEAGKKVPIDKQGPTIDFLLELLKRGKVNEFNELRNKHAIDLDLSHKNLLGAKLSGADLSHAKLLVAKLSGADLSGADLSGADLSGTTNLSGANLYGTNLSVANLFRVNLSVANLSGANLSGADLSRVDLSGAANLSFANLSSSVIIGVKYQDNNLKCEGANFTESVIDDENLLKHLRNGKAKFVPQALKSKKELRSKLEEKAFQKEVIDTFLSRSTLPDDVPR